MASPASFHESDTYSPIKILPAPATATIIMVAPTMDKIALPAILIQAFTLRENKSRGKAMAIDAPLKLSWIAAVFSGRIIKFPKAAPTI